MPGMTWVWVCRMNAAGGVYEEVAGTGLAPGGVQGRAELLARASLERLAELPPQQHPSLLARESGSGW